MPWAGHALRSSHLGTTGRDRIRLFACSGTSREAYWGSLLYLVGALFFNVGCVEGLLPAAVQTPRLFWGLYYTPFVAGTACMLKCALLGAPQLATLGSWGWHGWLRGPVAGVRPCCSHREWPCRSQPTVGGRGTGGTRLGQRCGTPRRLASRRRVLRAGGADRVQAQRARALLNASLLAVLLVPPAPPPHPTPPPARLQP